MGIMDIILNLQRYSTEVLAYKLDAEFAAAVDAAANLLEAQGERIADLENELQAERHGCDQRPEFERVYMGRWDCGKEGHNGKENEKPNHRTE